MKSALEVAIDALTRRALTRWELEQHLNKKGFFSQEIGESVSRLMAWGYLDDRRLALDYCQTRAQRYSRRRIQEDLRRRGVDPVLIYEALAEAFAEGQELEQCIALAGKLCKKEMEKTVKAQGGFKTVSPRQKVGAKLLSRGYPLDIVLRALDIFCKSN
ncbi:MAG: regulatory protein RecX [Desulfitobacteriaceae bacterium]